MERVGRLFFLLPVLLGLAGGFSSLHAGHHGRVSFGVCVNCAPPPHYVWAPAPAPVVVAPPAPLPPPLVVAPYYGVPVRYYGSPVVVTPAPRPYVRGAGVVYYRRR